MNKSRFIKNLIIHSYVTLMIKVKVCISTQDGHKAIHDVYVNLNHQ